MKNFGFGSFFVLLSGKNFVYCERRKYIRNGKTNVYGISGAQ